MYQPGENLQVVLYDSQWKGTEGLARLVLLHKLQDMGVMMEAPAARFTIPHEYGTSYDCLCDFVQFMELEPAK